MKCQRCSAEIPGGSQFCMKCGTPVLSTPASGGITMARSIALPAEKKSKGPLIAGITAALALLALALFFGLRALTDRTDKVPDGSRVVAAPGVTPTGSGLVDKNARVAPPSRLTDVPGKVPAAQPQPVDIIDYLSWLQQIDRERLTLYKRQMGQAFEWSARGPANMYTEEMKENPDHNKSYSGFQQSFGSWQGEWQGLSSKFIARKNIPQACLALHNNYYEILSQLTAQMTTLGNGFSDAMGGNPSSAIDSLMALKGNQEGEEACAKANQQLRKICEQFRLSAFDSWEIKAEPGQNLFSLGGLR